MCETIVSGIMEGNIIEEQTVVQKNIVANDLEESLNIGLGMVIDVHDLVGMKRIIEFVGETNCIDLAEDDFEDGGVNIGNNHMNEYVTHTGIKNGEEYRNMVGID